MTDNMKNFLEKVSADKQLTQAFEQISGQDAESAKAAMTKLALEHGVTLTDADFAQDAPTSCELSDEELETVSGGKECYCAIGGGGKGNKQYGNKTCTCVMVGVGRTKEGNDRCVCVGGGIGYD